MSQTPLKRKQVSISSFFAKAGSPPSTNGITRGKSKRIGSGTEDSSFATGKELKRASPPSRFNRDGDGHGRADEGGVTAVDDGDEDEEVILPTRKRTRRNEGNNGSVNDMPQAPRSKKAKEDTSLRTEKFRFQSSPVEVGTDSADGNAPNDDLDAETQRKRKEQLHQKFVRRLGGPDCLPSTEYSTAGGAAEDMGVADSDVEAAEEDETPPAPRGRGSKKAGASKLTPMEKQILEIKRKHLDAIVVFQVGYKFQFFGEDARIAAKELGLVCIPGKLRYDERKFASLQPSQAHH